jgi:hypothetical protein
MATQATSPPSARIDAPVPFRQAAANPIRAAAVTFGPSVALDLALTAVLVRAVWASLGRGAGLGGALRLTGVAAAVAGLGALRRRELRWGATDEEVRAELPGDTIVPRPVWHATRAITVDASPAAVWPWLVQMGQGRGGLYSYDFLENLAGLDIHSVDRVVPELQHLAVGDHVPLAPGQKSMVVALLEPDHALVLSVADPQTGLALGTSPGGAGVAGSWAFVVRPHGEGKTRLVHRFRFGARRRALGALGYALLIEVPHFVMEWRMLRGIKARAEARAHETGDRMNPR